MKQFTFTVLSIFFVCALFAQNDKDANGKQGPWKVYHEGSSVIRYIGQFKNDIPQGRFTYYRKTGEILSLSTFSNEGKDCYVEAFHANGKPMTSGLFRNKVKDSVWMLFNEQGQVLGVDQYVDGKLHGMIYTYLPGTTQVLEETTYVNGLKVGPWKQYYNTGELKSEGVYRDGELEGKVVYYFEGGRKENVGYYKHAVKNGWWIYYSKKTGKVSEKAYYLNGQILEGDELEKHLAQKRTK